MTQHIDLRAHHDIIICTEDATEDVGTARVEYRPWANEVILRDVDFATRDMKTAVIMALQADVDHYANKAFPEPTNAEKLDALWDDYAAEFTWDSTFGEYLDSLGVTAPEETK